MTLKGHMVNGKFMDESGRVYDTVPKDAEIIDSIGKGKRTAGKVNGNGNTGNTDTDKPESRTPDQVHQAPIQADQVYYPKGVSYEILDAEQTTTYAQITVRAHYKGQYADAVIHHDFEVEEKLMSDQEFLKFRQTSLETAYAKAVQIARKLLCEDN
ncbi:MAG: hypothetical protein HF975_04420 [ANME-2 cluster archaeon]|nr:hypothetical protein [ANME-2 cluster archaeon]